MITDAQRAAGTELTRVVKEAAAGVVGRGIVRIDPADARLLGMVAGDVARIRGNRETHARILFLNESLRGKGIVVLDGIIRRNAGVQIGESVTLSLAQPNAATSVTLSVTGASLSSGGKSRVVAALEHIPITAGDSIRLPLMGGNSTSCEVTATRPSGPVLITTETRLDISAREVGDADRSITYEDLGGVDQELQRVREMVELPLRQPELFERVGIDPPRGILFSGPPGTGKTLLARAIAYENKCSFFQISGPEIVAKHYGESEAQLRSVFEQARAKAPSIVFLDELDAIAPKREGLSGDRQVERRIVGQLLTLMDGIRSRGAVTVIGATNLPDSIDPALRRPGRFDREIRFGAPDQQGRRQILEVHSKTMPLSQDVDLDHIARISHGYVGADLAALCREAGMAALRRVAKLTGAIEDVDVGSLFVTAADFDTGFAETRPSALREFLADVPNVSWDMVGGLDKIRQTLIEAVVWPILHADRFAALNLQPAKGVLLHGAPGTGKTLLAKALATEAGVNFISVRGPQLLNQFLGESERAVRDVFSRARSSAPTIIFFDEIDAIAPARSGTDGGTMDRIVSQLLTEIDGIEEFKNVFLLGATNRIDCVDPALLRPGRFDHIIQMPLPDAAARQAILAIYVSKVAVTPDVRIEHLAMRTSGYTGAELANLVHTAARACLRRSVDADSFEPVLGAEDFEAAFAAVDRRPPALQEQRETSR
ncbi:putative Vesicle-fusing ATPase [Bradyrhizobium sp. ORS 278]|uniref:AAA family ATPase n=1 Tax=Bradyrhizobium sp. (strain ORS 278) TaxID=114615 RepID=UPI0001507D28|nr:AAA family ATPase [Bradyrhizobium sp. ORS 278]CAL75176.1 putative Vesicle-fusing ATPase [Bradyrhizobium sp. ORS 278]